MKILIVEDETAAYENLADMILSLDSSIEIMGNTESVRQTVRWLQANPRPDLIFMDIHLSDGSAFTIFDKIKLEVPVVFTTAYDRYAIEAFKKYGVIKGMFLTIKRILKCHPFHPGGYDPLK